MRTTWNGSISFGLVSIPVGLAPATKPAARASDVSFRMLHRECGTPIKQKRYCPVHERDLGPDEIVKGWEVAKGQFVIVEDEEIEALTNRDDSRSIEISRFVDASEVDPIYFDRTYFLVPAQAPAARRPYVLLLNAMNESGMAALGRFVQQGKEKLCLIRPKGDALALETLFLAADVYSQAEIEEAVEETSVKAPELALAQQVIESLAGEFDASVANLAGWKTYPTVGAKTPSKSCTSWHAFAPCRGSAQRSESQSLATIDAWFIPKTAETGRRRVESGWLRAGPGTRVHSTRYSVLSP